MPRKRYLNNLLDKNFESMLSPLNTAVSVLFLPNYSTRDCFITPNGNLQKLKASALIIFFLLLNYMRLKESWVLKQANDRMFFVTASVYFDWVHYSLAFVCLFVFNVINTENYVSLVLNLQKAFRNLNDEKTIKKLKFWNWVSMVILPVYYFLSFYPNGDFSVAAFLNVAPLVYFDVIVVYTIRMMCVIENELGAWLKALQCYIERVLKLDYDSKEIELKMFQSYHYVLRAFELFKKICQVPILFRLTETVSHILIYLQVNIDFKKQSPEESLAEFLLKFRKIATFCCVLKNFLVLVTFCIVCEKFYCHVAAAEEICKKALMLPITEDFRKLSKNLCRYNRARFSRLRVSGATVDAHLPLRLLGILAAYIAVMLQFDFL